MTEYSIQKVYQRNDGQFCNSCRYLGVEHHVFWCYLHEKDLRPNRERSFLIMRIPTCIYFDLQMGMKLLPI